MHDEPVRALTRDEVRAAIARNDPDDLSRALLAVALHEVDAGWAAALVLGFVTHTQPVVRGNALLALGHVARRHGQLHGRLLRARTQTALEVGLRDPDAYVRGQADAAACDVEQFLGWRFRANPARDWQDGVPVPTVHFVLNDRVSLDVDGVVRSGRVVALLAVEPEPTYLVDLHPNDPDSITLPVQATEAMLRPSANESDR